MKRVLMTLVATLGLLFTASTYADVVSCGNTCGDSCGECGSECGSDS